MLLPCLFQVLFHQHALRQLDLHHPRPASAFDVCVHISYVRERGGGKNNIISKVYSKAGLQSQVFQNILRVRTSAMPNDGSLTQRESVLCSTSKKRLDDILA